MMRCAQVALLACLVAQGAAVAEQACDSEDVVAAVQFDSQVRSKAGVVVAKDDDGDQTEVWTAKSIVSPNYRVHHGRYLNDSHNILQADMNLTRATWLCDKISSCVGFTFSGENLDTKGHDDMDSKMHRFYFKSTFSAYAGNWTSYEKVQKGLVSAAHEERTFTVVKGPAEPLAISELESKVHRKRGGNFQRHSSLQNQGRELRLNREGRAMEEASPREASANSGKKRYISFTCLTETYLGKGHDLDAIFMYPAHAPDFCSSQMEGRSPCVGWTYHGENGTMSNMKLLSSPFFDREQTIYFKKVAHPGSSASWVGCMTVDANSANMDSGLPAPTQ